MRLARHEELVKRRDEIEQFVKELETRRLLRDGSTEMDCSKAAALIRRLAEERDEARAEIEALTAKLEKVTEEAYVLRQLGNKDCTAMADEELARRAAARVSEELKP